MKNKKTAMSIFYASLFILICLALFLLQNSKYAVCLVVNNDGYFVSREDLKKSLFSDSPDMDSAKVKASAFSMSDIVFQKLGRFYMGEEKTPVNDSYPLFINNSSALLNLMDRSSLINDDFEFAKAYSGLYVNNGITFNPDMEKAYREEFMLMALDNGLFVNVKPFKVTGSFFIEKNIPLNSVIRFMENEIRYYSLQEDTFVMYIIKPVGSSTVIETDGVKYAYYDFLEKLGLYEKEILREQEKAVSQDKETAVLDNETLAPDQNQENKGSYESAGGLDSEEPRDREQEKQGVKPSIPKIKEPGASVTPTPADSSRPEDDVPNPVQQVKPAKPAEAATSAPPTELNSPVSEVPAYEGGTSDEEPPKDVGTEDPGNPEWKMPVVKLGAFDTTVYSIFSLGMNVVNSEFLYKTGISFEVYDGQKLVMRKSYFDSGDVSIAPLNPDKDYRVVVTMTYIDKYWAIKYEKITEATVHTKPLSQLIPLHFNWSNGDIFSKKIQIKDLVITNAVESTREIKDSDGNTVIQKTYLETVRYMNRAEVVITSKEDASVNYTFTVPAKSLENLCTGVPIVYESLEKLLSDKEYYYEYICYDRFGNILPQEGILKGTTHTCKQAPKAGITLIKNEVKNVEIKFSADNPDKAEVVEGSLYFAVYDSSDNPVMTTIARKDGLGGYSAEEAPLVEHPLSFDGEAIKFLDLLDQEVYTVRVFCSYNINDGKGLYEYAVIGETQFTTMSITALGYAFFDVAVKEVTDHSASLTIALSKPRTDERLFSLISEMDIAFVKSDTSDGSGINITYGFPGIEGSDGNPWQVSVQDGKAVLSKEAVAQMKADENNVLSLELDGLNSVTGYSVIITPRVLMGVKGQEIYRNIQASYAPKSFMTMKKSPVIDIDAIYASADFIKLYGVSVNDPDEAVAGYPVSISIYDEEGRQIGAYEIPDKNKVSVVDVSNLKKDKTYTFRFFAKEYNNGQDMTTYRKNYELYYSPLFEKKEYLKILTREAVSGSIDLLGMNQYKLSNKLEILAGDNRLVSTNSRVTITKLSTGEYRYVNGGQSKAKFSIAADFGNNPVNGFQIRYSYTNRPTTYQLYLSDPDTDPAALPIASFRLEDKTIDQNTSRWTDVRFFDSSMVLTGQKTLYLITKTDSSNTYSINNLWGIRFFNAVESWDSSYYANLNAMVNDPRSELGEIPSYRLKIYKDNVWVDTRRHEWIRNEDGTYTLNMYKVGLLGLEILVDTKVFSGEDRFCDTDFYYKVEKGYHTYRVELWATVYNYEIRLDQEEWTSEKKITGLKTEEDLRNIRYGLDNKYFALNDISLSIGVSNITSGQTFNGELDFRGHTLTYGSQGYLISTMGYYGTLKNMVFTYRADWGTDQIRHTDYIVSSNYGRIQNIMVIRNNGNYGQNFKQYSAGICYYNYPSGIVENFVVKLSDPYIETNVVAGVADYNLGIIRNGYVYGQPISITAKANVTELQYAATSYMGGIVAINRQSGRVENVYSLIDINSSEVAAANYAFSLVGYNQGTVKNSFSAGDVFYGGVIRQGFGPSYRSVYANNPAKNTYYYSGNDYGSTDNSRIAKLVLYDLEWYDRLFNASDSTKPGQMDISPVELGYYPHVVWPGNMPAQEFIPLPEITEQDDIDIISSYVTEQGKDYAVAVITLDNREEFEITDIQVRWLNAQIIDQEAMEDDLYRVKVRLTQKEDTKYFSAYEIASFTYSIGFRGMTRTVTYDTNAPTVPAEFYKPITSVEQWSAIKDDLTQNYRLAADLDFAYRDPKLVVMPANVTQSTSDANFKKDAFSGKLDGDGYKISFVDTGEYGYVIGKLTGTVKNLSVEKLNAEKGTGRFKGFIGRMLEGSVADNVHILGMSAVTYEHFGAVTGDICAAAIMNSSAHDIRIDAVSDGNYTQFIGGLAGKQRSDTFRGFSIYNSYVDGFNFEIQSCGDCGGVGGILGFGRAALEIEHVYAVRGTINTAYKNAGGLIGTIDTYSDYSASTYILKDYYVDVDIKSITERAGGAVGFTALSNSELEVNGLVLGSVATTKQDPGEIGRFFGMRSSGDASAGRPYGNYSYQYAYLNGKLNLDDNEILTAEELAAIKSDLAEGGSLAQAANEKLLTREILCDPNAYETGGLLLWDTDFFRNDEELRNGILPKLLNTSGSGLVPYQENYVLEDSPIKVTGIRSLENGELYTIQIELVHDESLEITGANFEGLTLAVLPQPDDAFKIIKTETGTVLEYVLKAEGYFDAYYMTGITYRLADDPAEKVQEEYLNAGIYPRYLEISTIGQWNQLMAPEMFGQKWYNVRLIGNLDFSENGGIAAKNVYVNNLAGGRSAGETIFFKGIDMESPEPLIGFVHGDIHNIDFQNIALRKTKAVNPDPVNNFGLIGGVTGNIYDTSFNNISINAYNASYAGIAASAFGNNHDIDATDISVKSEYGTTPAKRATGGFVGRLSGSGSVYNVAEKNIIVEGKDYTGGIVGMQEDGRYIWNIDLTNAVVSALTSGSSNNYTGGIVGYANNTSLGDTMGAFRVKRVVVAGNYMTGGAIGQGHIYGNRSLSEQQDDDYPVTVEQAFVINTSSYAGGAAGGGIVRRTTVRDSYVFGRAYVGGITGYGSCYFDSLTDSTVSTVYDRNTGDTSNQVFQDAVTKRKTYYQELDGDEGEKAVYNKAIEILNYAVTPARNTAYSTKTFSNTNIRIGGISGYTISVWNSVVANCRIGAFGAVDVGGIVGRTIAASETWPYRITACGSQNSEIYGASNIGGIVGEHNRGYIESCYSNSNVTAATDSAGGIAGIIKPYGFSDLSETPYINHVFYAGTVTAPSYAAGITGRMMQDLYNVNEGWLMLGNVKVTNVVGTGNFLVNKQASDIRRPTKAYSYENSTLTFGTGTQNARDFYNANPSLKPQETAVLTTEELKNKATYTGMLNWSLENAGFTARYWNYNGLANNYMPYLTHAPANTYNSATAVDIMKYQEGYKPDPDDPTKPERDAEGSYVYKYKSYDGGIPVPGSGAGIIKALMLKLIPPDKLPEVHFYTVDADRLNIEFDGINANAGFTVMANGKEVAKSSIDRRVFTLAYDFKTELEVSITDETGRKSFNLWPEDVSRNIMTWNSDYYYISGNGISGSKPKNSGVYVNLYAGKALDANGNVYDIETGDKLRTVDGISLMDRVWPLYSFRYEDYKLETYLNYSSVDSVTRERLRLYVKDGSLSALSSYISKQADSLVLDSYNGDEYCAVLSGGSIINMTDSAFKLPEDFDNQDIQYMSNNLDSTGHIVLVRYADGAVVGFNYITGEKLDINSPRGTITQLTDKNGTKTSSANVSSTNFSTAYSDIIIFEGDLTDSGWAEVNGSSIENGLAVAGEDIQWNGDRPDMGISPENGTLTPGNNGSEDENQAAGTGITEGVWNELPGAAGNSNNNTGAQDNSGGQKNNNESLASDSGNTEDNGTSVSIADDTKAGIKAAILDAVKQAADNETLTKLTEAVKKAVEQGNIQAVTAASHELEEILKNQAVTVSDEVLAAIKAALEEMLKSAEKAGAPETKLAALKEAIEEITGQVDSYAMSTETSGDENKETVEIGDKKKAEDKNSNKKQPQYVPVYNVDKSKYELFSEEELLTKPQEELESMNEKVERSGHMIEYHGKQEAGIKNPGDENLYGYLLIFSVISGIAVLLYHLLPKKQKENIT